jgi:hypothetical protein
VDDVPRYIDATSGRLPEHLRSRVVFYGTDVQMTTFQGRIATEYVTLPNICPDFVYLDGPSQYSVHGEINGVSTAHPDRLPMACDLLKLEHFFLPGTLLLIDGRTANARFLQANLQRQWRHEHDVIGDLTWLELMETPLGRFNRRQLEFCLGDSWPGLADPDGPSPNLSRTRVPG